MVNSINPELQPEPNITYIDGIHTEAGDWNRATLEYIAEIGPNLIAIDGLNPMSPTETIDRNAGYFKGNPNWKILAAEPISNTTQYPELYTGIKIPNKIDESYELELAMGAALTASGLLGLAATPFVPEEIGKNPNRKISRRGFLYMGAGALAAAGAFVVAKNTGTTALLYESSKKDNRMEREQLRSHAATIDKWSYPMLARERWWIDGRTAIIADKTIHYQQIDQMANNGAILMGNHHGLKGPDYLENEELRNEDITRFVQETAKRLEEFSKQNSLLLEPIHLRASALFLSSYKVHQIVGNKAVNSKTFIDENIFEIAMNNLKI
jgi:hypothetical protein